VLELDRPFTPFCASSIRLAEARGVSRRVIDDLISLIRHDPDLGTPSPVLGPTFRVMSAGGHRPPFFVAYQASEKSVAIYFVAVADPTTGSATSTGAEAGP
jgi:hypothetical protein